MKHLFTIFIFCAFANTLWGQVFLSGQVMDENGQPMQAAGIALLRAPDSSFVRGVLSVADGSFAIPNIEMGEYWIMASALGYERTFTERIRIDSLNKRATVEIKLLPKSNLLKEAEIVASRPLFEQKADRLVVNVANSPIASGGTAIEILKKVPGVLVVQDRVTLAGNQSVQIWIDGRPSQYADMDALLRDMPGDQIDRIELITQPGSRYDAAGGAIINIILKRDADLGLTGTLSMGYGFSVYDQTFAGTDDNFYRRYAPSVSANYRNKKVNLFGSYSFIDRTLFSIFQINRFIGTERYDQINYSPFDVQINSFRLGGDFYASKKTTLSASFRGFLRDEENPSNNVTQVYDNISNTFAGAFTTLNNTIENNENYAGTLGFRHDFDERGDHSLTADLEYNRYNLTRNSSLNIFQNEPGSPNSLSSQLVDQPIDLWVGKLDYTLPIDSTFKAESGVKTSFATIDNDLRYLRGTTLDPSLSNRFLYKENINAAYVNLSKKIKSLDLNAGLRMEQTIATGETGNIRVLDRNYVQWFPSASALYHVGEHFGLQTSYSKRVNRPGFQQQNPFAFFIDSLTYTLGNPTLRPETQHTGQFAVTYDGQPFFRVSYGRTNDVIVENAPQLQGTKTFTTAANLATYERWALELNFPVKFKKIIDGFGGNQFIYNGYDAQYLGESYKQSKWNWLAYAQINVNVSENFKLEIGGWYITDFLQEFFTINTMGGLSGGASYTFWDKRARLSLSTNDLLYSQNSDVFIDYSDIVVRFRQYDDSRNFRLTFSYQFGNTKVKTAKRRQIADEETSRVKIE